MFYVLIFSLAAVLLIVAGVTTMSRRRRSLRAEEANGTASTGMRATLPTAPTPTRKDAATARQSAPSPSTTGGSVTDAGNGPHVDPRPHRLHWGRVYGTNRRAC